jgi:hypothetical protein
MMNAAQEPTTPYTRQGEAGHAPPHVQPPPIPPSQARLRDSRSKSPALAALLSMMPGLGQVYVGYYQRGFIHAVVIASLVTILSSGTVERISPLFGLFMAFFWLYNIIDAARRASLYNDALAGNPSIDLPQDFKTPGIRGSIIGGSIFIAGGFLLLLHTRFGMSLDWMEQWWPVALILFGVYLVARALQERRTQEIGAPR